MNKDKRAIRAKQLANKYANQVTGSMMKDLESILSVHEIKLNEKARQELDHWLGKSLGLSYALGWILGTTKAGNYIKSNIIES